MSKWFSLLFCVEFLVLQVHFLFIFVFFLWLSSSFLLFDVFLFFWFFFAFCAIHCVCVCSSFNSLFLPTFFSLFINEMKFSFKGYNINFFCHWNIDHIIYLFIFSISFNSNIQSYKVSWVVIRLSTIQWLVQI